MKLNYSSPSPKKKLTLSFSSAVNLTILFFALLFSSAANAQLAVNCTGTAVTCTGLSNGSASVNVGSGTPPYVYHWSNGATTSSISGLVPGTYTVIVNDNVQDTA